MATAPDKPWAAPTKLALNNTGPVTNPNGRRYDCTSLSYRMIDDLSKTMHEGCFVSAAFGMVDPDTGIAILNGSDEAEQLKQGSSIPSLSVLPYSGSTARFGGFPGQGTYLYIYSYFPNHLKTSRDSHLRRYEEVVGDPTFTVSDASGQPLPVNPLAIAYASHGQWFVTESPSHALVRVNLATFSVLPFAKSYDVTGKPYASHQASMAVTEDGRYAAAASNEFYEFKVYDLAGCGVAGGDDALAPQSCKSHDYWNYVASQVTGELQGISKLRFVDDGLISFDATTTLGTDSYLLAPDGPITSLIPYLGVGDSFAAGQGAFNYLSGTDTAINHCHLSSHSYPLLLNGDLFGNRGHSVACSGAQIHDVGNVSDSYTGQSSDQRTRQERQANGSVETIVHDFSPGYLAQEQFVTSYRPGIITVEIGGNDVGFKDMLLNCMSPLLIDKHPAVNANSCYRTYEDRLEVAQTIDRTYNKWVQLFRQLQKSSPASQLYVIGYPQIISANGACGLNVYLTPEDVNFARDVTTYLNATIQKAARAVNVPYVDISQALKGVELCGGATPAVNGLTAGNDALEILGQESFHPTAFGQQLIEQTILRATHNFTLATPATEPTPVPPTDAPKSGRAVRTIVPDNGMTTGSASRGGSTTIHTSGAASGLAANTSFTVAIGSITVGSGTTNDHGDVQTTVTIPPTTTPGTQPVSVTGTGNNGDPITIIKIIYVPETNDDYDGDGIPNGQDSCPLTRNSGIDVDQDGLDDACDQSITAPPTPTQSGPTATPTPPQTPSGPSTPPTTPQTPSSPQTTTTPTPTGPSTPTGEPTGASAQPATTVPEIAGATLVQAVTEPRQDTLLRVLDVTGETTRMVHVQLARGGQLKTGLLGNKMKLNRSQSSPSELARTGLPSYRWYVWIIASLCMFLLLYGSRTGLQRIASQQ